MAALAGILQPGIHHGSKMTQALASNSVRPNDATTGTAGSTGTSDSSTSDDSSSATISANDFLTLLVTEMQNQDPTADTDPNEYINQLVQVNSLEQLIDINQNLSTALGTSSTTSGSTGDPGTKAVQGGSSLHPSTSAPSASASSGSSKTGLSPGNLAVPAAAPAATRVAHALNGSTQQTQRDMTQRGITQSYKSL
jgi:flagellar basal-body rod modification protein FlgD